VSDSGRRFLRLALVYSLFVGYVTTIPFSFAPSAAQVAAHFHRVSWIPFVDPDGTRASIADCVQNVVLFVPLGLLAALQFRRRFHSTGRAIVAATAWGLILSASVETLQLFTLDRTTSPTDLVTNTLGTAVGAVLAEALSRFATTSSRHPSLRRLLRQDASYAALSALAVVTIGAWQPFDFTLDVGQILSKGRALWAHPIDIPSMPSDELAVALRMALLVAAAGWALRETGARRARSTALFGGLLLAVGLEASQLVIESRMPGAQDALAGCVGALAGALALPRLEASRSRIGWAAMVVGGTILSAAIADLSPFRLSPEASPFNVVPFLAHYRGSGMAPMADVLDAALRYLPAAFVLAMMCRRRSAWVLALLVTGVCSGLLEAAQRVIDTRHADISDPIASLVGAAIGVYAWQARPAGYPREEPRNSAI